jgi:hypothetical protein
VSSGISSQRKEHAVKTALYAGQLHGLKAYSDGSPLGHVDEFYFDDQSWSVRYLVLYVGLRLKNRKVLISRLALGGIHRDKGGVRIRATEEQIRQSPDASTDLPVALALEAKIHRHYRWGASWPESFIGSKADPAEDEGKSHDPHLRSTRVLTGTTLTNDAGDVLGTAIDFLVDPETWQLEFVVADCDQLHNVLIDPKLVRAIDVTQREIRIDRLDN